MAEPNSAGLPAKLYFRIGEVADLVGVEPHVLRYWEREFRAIRPSKSARGQRVYSRRDVENLMRVRELLYGQGFTIAGARKKLQHPASSPAETSPEPSAEPGPSDEAKAGAETPAANVPSVSAPSSSPPHAAASKAREQLLAIREEIEAFLVELEPSRGSP